MDIKKGSIECVDPNCKHTFTWVSQSIPRQKATAPVLVAHEIYEPKKDEAMVNKSTLRCYCPKCGASNKVDLI
ncbi:MAG: hypothetical protein ABS934_09370 [Psychrobacillus sp.]